MEARIEAIFEETLLMERQTARYYRLLAKEFESDAVLWSGLASEEEYHAVIVRAGKDSLFTLELFPIEALDLNLANIQKFNAGLEASLLHYESTPPTRNAAFRKAIELEGSSGEYYFQLAIESTAQSPALATLRDLAGNENNHANRILDYRCNPGPLKNLHGRYRFYDRRKV